MRNQQPGVPQPWLRQQTGVNDMQLRQQHFIYKQIQELQRQQQLQQLDQEVRQENSLNPLSGVAKQAASDQLPSLASGAPIHDTSNYMWPGQPVVGDSRIPSSSQMLMVGNTNWAHRNGSPAMQGFSNGHMFAQDQSQASRSMGFLPQQLDQSLYSSPVVPTRGAFNQYSHFQGINNDGADMFSKSSGNQLDKTITQSAAFNVFESDQSAVFPTEICVSDGVSVSSQGFQAKNLFGHAPISTLHNGLLSGSFQQMNSLSRNVQVQEFHDRQEHRVGWEGNLQEKVAAQAEQPSLGLVTLDRTEAKILFNTDEGAWDNSFSRIGGMNSGGCIPGNQLEGNDNLSAFPSIQSGSWSALMQSAVAEASSSDTGLQDEWSGLSFPKTEVSTENRAIALNDSGKQPTAWVDNNLQTGSSLTSGPFPLFGDSNPGQSGHGLPGFQQSASHESLHQSPKETNKWINQNPQQKPPIDTTFQIQTPMHMNNTQEGAWGRQIHEQSRISSQSVDMELNSQNMQAAWARQRGMSLYNTGSQSGNKRNGWNINQSLSANEDSTLKILDNEQATQHAQSNESRGDTHMENDHDGRMRSSGDNMASLSFPNSTGGFEQVRSGASSPQVRADPYMNNFTALPNSSTSKINQEINQQVQHSHQLDYGKQAMFDSSMYRDNENVGKHQHQSGQGLDVRESSLNTSDRGSGETYDKKHENYYQEISDSYISGQAYSRQHTVGDGMRGNAQSVACDARPLFSGNQQSVGQVGRKSSGPRKFQYHPMGNLGVGLEPSDTTKHATHSHPLSQWSTRGFKSQEQGFLGQSKSVGHVVSNSGKDIEKGQLPDLQRNPKGAEEVPARSVHPGYESAVSASFDRAATFSAQNKRTIQTSQNMLELLHKVDQSREGNTVTDVASSDHYQSEMPEATAPDRSAAHLHLNRSSGSQGFGLRLGPPSQRPSSSNHALPSQMSSPIADDLNSRHIDQEGNSGTVMPGIPFPRNQLQQQHISNASGQVADQALHLSFASQADMDAQSKLASHFKQMRDSHDGSEQPQASFPGATARSLPFNLAAGDACGPIPSTLSYSSSAVQSQSINANSSYLRGSGQQSPVSQLPVSSGMSHGGFSSMLQNVWTNVTSQQRLPGGLSSKGPNLFQSMHTSNSLEAASWSSRKADSQGVNRGGNGPSDFGTGSLSSQQFTYGEEQPSKDSSLQQTPHERIKTAAETSGSFQEHVHPHQQDLGRGMPGQEQSLISQTEHVSFQNTDSSNNENESFGHSLKSPGDPHQQYSLLHQVQAMKVADIDSSRKSVKRLKGADFGANAQESVAKTGQWFPYGPSSAIRDPVENKLGASSQHMQFPSSDSKMLCFSSEGKEDRNANASHLHLGDAPSNDVAMFGRNDLQNRSSPLGVAPAPSFRGNEHSRINPQMAPSWFERYGTFKNGQILALHEGVEGSRRDAKMAAQQFFFGKVSEGLQTHTTMEQAHAGNAVQAGSIWQSRMDRVPAHEHLSSPHSLPPAVDSSLVLARTKKRKSAGLLPWHKEVTQGSQRLQSLSMAELDWAQATNRLVDKVEDETEMIDDGPSMPRPRRRLILATQLMQQLFRSLPAAVLSADAFSEFESVAYCSAKLALGDACSLISCSGSDYCVQPNSSNMISGKAKGSERARDQFFSKLVEDFIGKARKLENDLLRLDKRASSILDLRDECQDLEKVSVIIRFARFHGRGNADGVESSSSAELTAQKSYPQRYVTALPLPRNLPDGVPCLSL
eukprot:TRINITY_DN5222_c0_g1_i4.p1 TRINITY_DN5222_c0_g1~~TRINITY_DN5222_c0_g1_i4.p1  ORF type:complete len:1743 (-),score=402.89 TRINITY_DN5222_c0_g1_i4:204-5432(-)